MADQSNNFTLRNRTVDMIQYFNLQPRWIAEMNISELDVDWLLMVDRSRMGLVLHTWLVFRIAVQLFSHSYGHQDIIDRHTHCLTILLQESTVQHKRAQLPHTHPLFQHFSPSVP